MMFTGHTRFQAAANCQKVDRPPVWLMRQAGRYMDVYQAVRKKHSFLEMIHRPELACEVTMQPIDAFDMDAAILFCDILVTAEAMGANLTFKDGVGPLFVPPIKTIADCDTLVTGHSIQNLDYVLDAISLCRTECDKRDKALLGFAGAPFTVACYLFRQEGQESTHEILNVIQKDPGLYHAVMERLTLVTIDYLNAQRRSGVDAVQIFDSWASAFSRDDYEKWAFPYLKKVVDGLDPSLDVPLSLFCRHTHTYLDLLLDLNPSILSVDWTSNMADIAPLIPSHIAIQGNLNPQILCDSSTVVRDQTQTLLELMKHRPGFIVNLGHGITPKSKEDNVATLIQTVKDFSN